MSDEASERGHIVNRADESEIEDSSSDSDYEDDNSHEHKFFFDDSWITRDVGVCTHMSGPCTNDSSKDDSSHYDDDLRSTCPSTAANVVVWTPRWYHALRPARIDKEAYAELNSRDLFRKVLAVSSDEEGLSYRPGVIRSKFLLYRKILRQKVDKVYRGVVRRREGNLDVLMKQQFIKDPKRDEFLQPSGHYRFEVKTSPDHDSSEINSLIGDSAKNQSRAQEIWRAQGWIADRGLRWKNKEDSWTYRIVHYRSSHFSEHFSTRRQDHDHHAVNSPRTKVEPSGLRAIRTGSRKISLVDPPSRIVRQDPDESTIHHGKYNPGSIMSNGKFSPTGHEMHSSESSQSDTSQGAGRVSMDVVSKEEIFRQWLRDPALQFSRAFHYDVLTRPAAMKEAVFVIATELLPDTIDALAEQLFGRKVFAKGGTEEPQLVAQEGDVDSSSWHSGDSIDSQFGFSRDVGESPKSESSVLLPSKLERGTHVAHPVSYVAQMVAGFRRKVEMAVMRRHHGTTSTNLGWTQHSQPCRLLPCPVLAMSESVGWTADSPIDMCCPENLRRIIRKCDSGHNIQTKINSQEINSAGCSIGASRGPTANNKFSFSEGSSTTFDVLQRWKQIAASGRGPLSAAELFLPCKNTVRAVRLLAVLRVNQVPDLTNPGMNLGAVVTLPSHYHRGDSERLVPSHPLWRLAVQDEEEASKPWATGRLRGNMICGIIIYVWMLLDLAGVFEVKIILPAVRQILPRSAKYDIAKNQLDQEALTPV